MTVLDAYAVLALLKGEPAAEPVGRLLRDDPDAALTPLGVAEVLDHLVRVEDAAEEEAALDLAQLGLADPPPLDAIVATRAGLLRARHHHRSRRAVSLADCVVAEVARIAATPVATSDPHLLELCHDEAIAVVALPDSRGRVWSAPS
ncbi:MAG TPA: PIN domain-containing protein [Mycobacterium sp.]|nr:PIN domain-containing protein [Mycobacterium sp.]HUH70893.1 PIN domain-containing protein [Mycobacterium sp.]